MRRFSCFCFAGWVLLQAGAALAQSNTNTIYNINFNENGPGATYDSLALTGSGFYTPTTPLTVVSGGLGSGLTYELPYTINTPGHAASNQYEGIYLNDGSTKSDLVSFLQLRWKWLYDCVQRRRRLRVFGQPCDLGRHVGKRRFGRRLGWLYDK